MTFFGAKNVNFEKIMNFRIRLGQDKVCTYKQSCGAGVRGTRSQNFWPEPVK
jgi:hypothetical protein